VNDIVEILRLAHGGDGVAADGTFVPFTVPGDAVRVERGGKRARLVEIVSQGAWRATPPCSYFGRCGGCALQHVVRAPYLAWKREQVVAALAQRGFANVAVEETRAVPPGTRRRAVFKARRTADKTQLGFFERESRTLVDITECPLLVPELAKLIGPLREMLGRLLQPGEATEIHATATQTGIDLSLKLKRRQPPDALSELAQWAGKRKLARFVLDGELIAVFAEPRLTFGRIAVDLPAEAFLQPTAEGEHMLQELVREGVGSAKRVCDLFAGCGTFALFLASGRRIHAVDFGGRMIEALDDAARAGGAGAQVTTEWRDLFRRPLTAHELKPYDAVVIDPPRVGAKAQAEQLAAALVPRIVYVSCNPASFARDARVLADGGYKLARVVPVDQFLWSPHIELVGFFERG